MPAWAVLSVRAVVWAHSPLVWWEVVRCPQVSLGLGSPDVYPGVLHAAANLSVSVLRTLVCLPLWQCGLRGAWFDPKALVVCWMKREWSLCGYSFLKSRAWHVFLKICPAREFWFLEERSCSIGACRKPREWRIVILLARPRAHVHMCGKHGCLRATSLWRLGPSHHVGRGVPVSGQRVILTPLICSPGPSFLARREAVYTNMKS